MKRGESLYEVVIWQSFCCREPSVDYSGEGRSGLPEGTQRALCPAREMQKSRDVSYTAREHMQTAAAVFLSLLFLLGAAVSAHAQGSEWETLNNEARALHQKGQYDRAVVIAKKALEVAEQAVGPEHPAVATSLNNLAILYDTQGQYAQAEPLYKRALAIWEKGPWPDASRGGYEPKQPCGVRPTQGQYAQAEPLYKRALTIKEKALGPEHPAVATSLNNLAILYATQGQYAQAEPLYKRALAIWEKALGPTHPDVASGLKALRSSTARRPVRTG